MSSASVSRMARHIRTSRPSKCGRWSFAHKLLHIGFLLWRRPRDLARSLGTHREARPLLRPSYRSGSGSNGGSSREMSFSKTKIGFQFPAAANVEEEEEEGGRDGGISLAACSSLSNSARIQHRRRPELAAMRACMSSANGLGGNGLPAYIRSRDGASAKRHVKLLKGTPIHSRQSHAFRIGYTYVPERFHSSPTSFLSMAATTASLSGAIRSGKFNKQLCSFTLAQRRRKTASASERRQSSERARKEVSRNAASLKKRRQAGRLFLAHACSN